jgi:hypothetical protein
MVSVVIAALSGTASIGTAGLMDALNKAGLAHARHTRQPARRVFGVRLAGLAARHGPRWPAGRWPSRFGNRAESVAGPGSQHGDAG